MNKDTDLKILKLELKQQNLIQNNLQKKIDRYEKANNSVHNTIAQQDIDDLKTELQTCELQKEILSSKIDSLKS
tara:strand:+ start:302 stop:523 length:222 start_codon:yes stop_codon:yes gene_type:complete